MKIKNQVKLEEVIPKKQSFLKKNAIDLISLFIAFASLIATFYIGAQANELAKRTQPPYYSVTVNSPVRVFSYDENMYSTDGLNFKQKNDMPSGELSSVFLSTIQDDMVDIAYIPHNANENFEFAFESNNGLLFFMDDQENSKLIFTPADMKEVEAINDSLRIFHIIFKGYNKDYTVYSVIITLKDEIKTETITVNEKDVQTPVGYLNCYILNEDDIYTYSIYEKIVKDLNKGKDEKSQFTTKEIFETVTEERKLCCDKLSNSH